MQAKIRELYKASQESQAAAAMMGQGGQPINPYPGNHVYHILAHLRYAPLMVLTVGLQGFMGKGVTGSIECFARLDQKVKFLTLYWSVFQV